MFVSSFDENGEIFIDDSSFWIGENPTMKFLRIYRGCLSFLYHRVNLTPRSLWDGLYGPEAEYRRSSHLEDGQGLLYSVEYYDIGGRASGQNWEYAIMRMDLASGRRWWDPDTMEDVNWLLARPHVFPSLPALDQSASSLHFSESGSASEVIAEASQSSAAKVMSISELLNVILDFIIEPSEHSMHVSELKSAERTIVTPSMLLSLLTIMALLGVNRRIHLTIMRDRQDIYFDFTWRFGRMLPSTPIDWVAWDEVNPSLPKPLSPFTPETKDWRAYLLMFLRKGTPHIRNRWRLYCMSNQFARGRARVAYNEMNRANHGVDWRWNVGQLGVMTSLSPPDARAWEVTPPA